MRRVFPVVVLVISAAGILLLSQRLGSLETVAMLVLAAAGGVALATLAAKRK